jgi:osmotically-inducible protein OsmY
MVSTQGCKTMFSPTIVDDCRIAETATDCLRASPYKVLAEVACECGDGVLFLRGQVSSFYLKQQAQEAVATVSGVNQVVNEVEVD